MGRTDSNWKGGRWSSLEGAMNINDNMREGAFEVSIYNCFFLFSNFNRSSLRHPLSTDGLYSLDAYPPSDLSPPPLSTSEAEDRSSARRGKFVEQQQQQ
jgi:hypothetical protein